MSAPATTPHAGCGTCTLCCKLLAVDAISKPACSWCPHAEPTQGCTIYDERPQPCIDFECLWLRSQSRPKPLPENLRPDRCRVVLDGTADGDALVAHVDPTRPGAALSGPMGLFIAHALQSGVRVIVAVGPRRTVLTPAVKP